MRVVPFESAGGYRGKSICGEQLRLKSCRNLESKPPAKDGASLERRQIGGKSFCYERIEI
jgi:hypothetical protein